MQSTAPVGRSPGAFFPVGKGDGRELLSMEKAWSVPGLREMKGSAHCAEGDERRVLNFVIIPLGLYRKGCKSCRLELAGI